MVADTTYNPKASVVDKLGNPKCQRHYLTIRKHKTYLSKRFLNVETVQTFINTT